MSTNFGYSNQTRQPYSPPPPDSPTPSPAKPDPLPAGQSGRGGGWIMLLRVFLWLLFTVICMVGIFSGGLMIMTGLDIEEFAPVLAGLGIILVSVLLAFVAVASGMVALDAAQNIRRCAINSANILALLNQQVKR
ncbi:MAG: hypothetical protein HFF49_06150 [Lawsonibacter sp.]|jgi:hypothetical protein|nr:hypothetical protein [Lawsonibacter sp.]